VHFSNSNLCSNQAFLRIPLLIHFIIVDNALRTLGELKQTQSDDREMTSGVKRKDTDQDINDEDDEEDVDGPPNAAEVPNSHQPYNTRFKGVKRVKLGREVPEGFPYGPWKTRIPRKSAPTVLGSGSLTKQRDENGAGEEKSDSPKRRPRGRPRKNRTDRPPSSATKQVFDGVVVTKRAHPPRRAELQNTDATHHDPDADAEGDMDGDAEEIVVPYSVELNGVVGVAFENDHYEPNQVTVGPSIL
jgi:hypothetical protein